MSVLACSIAVRRALGRVVVTVHGELDGPGATILERVLSDLIEDQGNLDVVLDLTDAHLGDPLAVGTLCFPAEQARRHGATVSVCGPAVASR